MTKTILIIGMGPGLSLGVAEKFGAEGYAVGMISRNAAKLDGFRQQLTQQGITAAYASADVAHTGQMLEAIDTIQSTLGPISVLHYNAVDYRVKPILDETADELTTGFRISVANAFAAVKALLPDLKATEGSVLLTGGGSGTYPSPDMATISLGKAGIRNLALQLNQVLASQDVYVGTLTVSGSISPDSPTHSPKILAEKFWELHTNRDVPELVY